LRPQEPRYAYTLAFYLSQKGEGGEAAKTLEALTGRYPAYWDAYLFLGRIYEKQGKKSDAEKVYRKALTTEGIPPNYRNRIVAQLNALHR
jgi:Tfp pilus assembly protein PilF